MKLQHDESTESEAFLQPQASENDPQPSNEKCSPRKQSIWFMRFILELSMATSLVYFLFFLPALPTESLRKSPVPRPPRKLYTFRNDEHFAREDMFFNESTTLHTLHNWIPLSSASRGYVVVPDATLYDLPEPYTVALDRQHDGPGYMLSVFHQLHCLSYLAEHFQQGYGGIELTTKVAHHSAHCFNYLRQGIMCAADTTLEGKTGDGPGEGSEHVCADYEALLEWANAHAALRWREGLLPGDSIL